VARGIALNYKNKYPAPNPCLLFKIQPLANSNRDKEDPTRDRAIHSSKRADKTLHKDKVEAIPKTKEASHRSAKEA